MSQSTLCHLVKSKGHLDLGVKVTPSPEAFCRSPSTRVASSHGPVEPACEKYNVQLNLSCANISSADDQQCLFGTCVPNICIVSAVYKLCWARALADHGEYRFPSLFASSALYRLLSSALTPKRLYISCRSLTGHMACQAREDMGWISSVSTIGDTGLSLRWNSLRRAERCLTSRVCAESPRSRQRAPPRVQQSGWPSG